MRQDDFDDEDDTEPSYLKEVTPKGSLEGLHPASEALPRLMLEMAMTPQQMEIFLRGRAITAIVKAPTADWVVPLFDAAKEIGRWGYHVQATAPERKPKDTIARDQAIRALAAGRRILGVSQSPTTCLPEGMAGAADITVNVPMPDDLVIKRTIRAATGKYPRTMPRDIARGLSFAEICLAIRRGSKPGECVARLTAAKIASSAGDEDLSDVPELASLHGYGEAMEWAERLIADLDAWRAGKLDFSALERAAVLTSPPGMGKTTFVRSLAKALGVPLIATSVGGWFANSTGNLDGVIKQIDQVFNAAAAQAPAVLFLDEVEGIPNRATITNRGADWWMPVIGHMLTTLDSSVSGISSKLIIIGATNHPEKLDAALVRPGRLSRIIYIDKPDKQALAGILRQHLGSDLAGEDLSEVAAFGVGASGADVTDWVKRARSLARRAGRPVDMKDLLDQVAPRDDRPKEVAWRIAIHEAGHAVVMQVLGIRRVESVSMIASEINGGSVTISGATGMMSKSEIDAYVTFVLAGRCAEEAILDSVSTGAGGSPHSDLARATHMVTSAHTSMGMGETLVYRGAPDEFSRTLAMDYRLVQAIETDLRRLYGNAMGIVGEYREAVMAVARALMQERFLTGDRFREIFDRHPPGSKTIELDGRDG